MALVYCPECDSQVSDQAIACPKCGYPIAKNKERVEEYQYEKQYEYWD